jgi:hypothetical protein
MVPMAEADVNGFDLVELVDPVDLVDLGAAHVIDAGDAWFELDGTDRVGRVVASFRRAVYVDLGDAVLAIVSADAPPGPIHLRVGALARPAPGSRVSLVGPVPASARWRPPALDAALLRRGADAARRTITATATSGLTDHPALEVAESALGRGDLRAAVDALGGLGPGLTPAGDDVLGGLFVVLAAAGHEERELLEAAAGARTHAISRSFLTWAARGQAVEPVHLLLGALARTDPVAIERHREAVLALGHTSGADLLLGLCLGLGALQGADQVIAGGSTRAHWGPPSPPVRSTTAVREPARTADSMSCGSTRSSISLARLNISNFPCGPTLPHVR